MTLRRFRAVAVGLLAAALGALWLPQAGALDVDGVEVPAELRSGRVLLVRPNRIDVVEDGRVVDVVPVSGPVDLARLPDLVRDERFAARHGRGVVRLSATLAQRPGSRVTGSAPGLARLQVVTGRPAARIVGTRAGLSLDGVLVESVTPKGRPAPASPDRAAVRYTHGSQVSLTRSRLHNLGSTGIGGRPALEVSGGSSLRLTRSQVTAGTTGVHLEGAAGVVLDRVRIEHSQSDGITVTGGSRLSVAALTTRENGGGGLLVQGPVGRLRITGPVIATGNAGVGVRFADLDGAGIRRIRTAGNGDGGLAVRGGRSLEVGDVRATDEGIGVAVTSATGVRLRDVTADRVAAGLVVKDGTRISADRLEVTAARDEGIGVDGRRLAIRHARVLRSGEGVVVQDRSQDVVVADSTLEGERAALRAAPGSARVTVRHVVVTAPRAVALRSSAPGTLLDDVAATGAVGLDLRASASVDHGRVSAGVQALRAGPAARVDVDRSRLRSGGVAISAADGARVAVTNTRVDALRATEGEVSFGAGNAVAPLPIRWIAILGLTAMAMAVALELFRKLRDRGERRADAPVHVLNRT